MNKGGDLIYKCRLCGAVDRKTHVPDVSKAITFILLDGTTLHAFMPGLVATMHSVHYCGHPENPITKYGVADLVGGEEDVA